MWTQLVHKCVDTISSQNVWLQFDYKMCGHNWVINWALILFHSLLHRREILSILFSILSPLFKERVVSLSVIDFQNLIDKTINVIFNQSEGYLHFRHEKIKIEKDYNIILYRNLFLKLNLHLDYFNFIIIKITKLIYYIIISLTVKCIARALKLALYIINYIDCILHKKVIEICQS